MTLSILECESIVAMHEAGHAVACLKLGVPFSTVSIGFSEERFGGGVDTTGLVLHEADTEEEDRAALAVYVLRCRQQVIVCLAGRAAEERGARSGLTNGVGMASDLKDLRDARYFIRELLRAEHLLRHGGRHVLSTEWDLVKLPARIVEEMNELQAEAETLVADYFSSIHVVARELVTRKRLSASEVERVITAL